MKGDVDDNKIGTKEKSDEQGQQGDNENNSNDNDEVNVSGNDNDENNNENNNSNQFDEDDDSDSSSSSSSSSSSEEDEDNSHSAATDEEQVGSIGADELFTSSGENLAEVSEAATSVVALSSTSTLSTATTLTDSVAAAQAATWTVVQNPSPASPTVSNLSNNSNNPTENNENSDTAPPDNKTTEASSPTAVTTTIGDLGARNMNGTLRSNEGISSGPRKLHVQPFQYVGEKQPPPPPPPQPQQQQQQQQQSKPPPFDGGASSSTMEEQDPPVDMGYEDMADLDERYEQRRSQQPRPSSGEEQLTQHRRPPNKKGSKSKLVAPPTPRPAQRFAFDSTDEEEPAMPRDFSDMPPAPPLPRQRRRRSRSKSKPQPAAFESDSMDESTVTGVSLPTYLSNHSQSSNNMSSSVAAMPTTPITNNRTKRSTPRMVLSTSSLPATMTQQSSPRRGQRQQRNQNNKAPGGGILRSSSASSAASAGVARSNSHTILLHRNHSGESTKSATSGDNKENGELGNSVLAHSLMGLALQLTSQEWCHLGSVSTVPPTNGPDGSGGAAAIAAAAAAAASKSTTGDRAAGDDGVEGEYLEFQDYVERVTALLLVRLLGMAAQPGTFSDLSTSTICRAVLVQPDTWPSTITLSVLEELQAYVTKILQWYRPYVPYHNSEHAYHVTVSMNKLLDLMLGKHHGKKAAPPTFGLRHDPLRLMCLMFAALIHDTDHHGLPNRQLATEEINHPLAIRYNDQSIAENQSLYLAFDELLHGVKSPNQPRYANLRNVMCPTKRDYFIFRKHLINLVLNTDIASPEKTQLSRSKFKEAGFDGHKSDDEIRQRKGKQRAKKRTSMKKGNKKSSKQQSNQKDSKGNKSATAKKIPPRRAVSSTLHNASQRKAPPLPSESEMSSDDSNSEAENSKASQESDETQKTTNTDASSRQRKMNRRKASWRSRGSRGSSSKSKSSGSKSKSSGSSSKDKKMGAKNKKPDSRAEATNKGGAKSTSSVVLSSSEDEGFSEDDEDGADEAAILDPANSDNADKYEIVEISINIGGLSKSNHSNTSSIHDSGHNSNQGSQKTGASSETKTGESTGTSDAPPGIPRRRATMGFNDDVAKTVPEPALSGSTDRGPGSADRTPSVPRRKMDDSTSASDKRPSAPQRHISGESGPHFQDLQQPPVPKNINPTFSGRPLMPTPSAPDSPNPSTGSDRTPSVPRRRGSVTPASMMPEDTLDDPLAFGTPSPSDHQVAMAKAADDGLEEEEHEDAGVGTLQRDLERADEEFQQIGNGNDSQQDRTPAFPKRRMSNARGPSLLETDATGSGEAVDPAKPVEADTTSASPERGLTATESATSDDHTEAADTCSEPSSPQRKLTDESVSKIKPKKLGIRRSMDLSGELLHQYHSSVEIRSLSDDKPDDLKASVVMETIMTVADISQNLQSWNHMVKWSNKLYMELRRAHVSGRGPDVSRNWYRNQIGFLELYVLPSAKKLDETGVFGPIIGPSFAKLVEKNRDRWLVEGERIAASVIKAGKVAFPDGTLMPKEQCEEIDPRIERSLKIADTRRFSDSENSSTPSSEVGGELARKTVASMVEFYESRASLAQTRERELVEAQERLKFVLEDHQKEIAKIASNHHSKVDDLEHELEDMTEELERTRSTISNLKKERDDALQTAEVQIQKDFEIGSMREKLKESEERHVKSQEDIDQLRNQCEQQKTVLIMERQRLIDEKEDIRENLRAMVVQHAKESSRLSTWIDEARTELSALEAKCIDSDVADELRVRLSARKKEKAEIEKALLKLREKYNILTKQLEADKESLLQDFNTVAEEVKTLLERKQEESDAVPDFPTQFAGHVEQHTREFEAEAMESSIEIRNQRRQHEEENMKLKIERDILREDKGTIFAEFRELLILQHEQSLRLQMESSLSAPQRSNRNQAKRPNLWGSCLRLIWLTLVMASAVGVVAISYSWRGEFIRLALSKRDQLIERIPYHILCSPARPGTLIRQNHVYEAPWWAPRSAKQFCFGILCQGRPWTSLKFSNETLVVMKTQMQESQSVARRQSIGAFVGSDALIVQDEVGKQRLFDAPWMIESDVDLLDEERKQRMNIFDIDEDNTMNNTIHQTRTDWMPLRYRGKHRRGKNE